MSSILEIINGYSSFTQSLIGSAVFLFSSWLFRVVFNKAKSSGKILFEEHSKIDVIKRTLHKEYINTSNVQLSTFGSVVAFLHASRWLVRALLIFIFFSGLSSILKGDWLFVAAYWFCFNCVLEANGWVKDTSSEKSISHVPEDLKKDIYERFKPQPIEAPENTDDK
ncbi:hypothetical protein [Ferrimonas balearica]|uniref:hypothetical protein n=1 Tax=Ferrimonas balearica TaxID=44012 RepID=UPI001C99375F|nr:hypothetical protein [Ferrimonas balearica]MBY5990897.1 hypothetical protein [Ferrimonas balearica]